MRRFQFSLRTLLLFALFAGSAEALYLHWDPFVVHHLPESPTDFEQCQISRDGTRAFVLATRDPFNNDPPRWTKVLTVWRTRDGAMLRQFEVDSTQAPTGDLTVSPGGSWICLETHGVHPDETLWNVNTGKEFQPEGTQHHTAASDLSVIVKTAHLCAFSPDDRYIAFKILSTGGKSDGLRIYDMHDPDVAAATFAPEFGSLAKFSPDVSRLALMSEGGTLRLWNVAQRKIEATKTFPGFYASRLTFARDSKLLALSAFYPQQATLLFDIATGKVSPQLPGLAAESPLFRSNMCAPFSADGSKLITLQYLYNGNVASVFETSTFRQVSRFIFDARSMDFWTFTPGGKKVIAATEFVQQAWDSATGDELPFDQSEATLLSKTFTSANGKTKIERGNGRIAIEITRRPPQPWGLVYLPEFWLTLLFAVALIWSLIKGKTAP